MMRCLFVSDLHGNLDRYTKLFRAVEEHRPDAVFMGGDLLPTGHLLSDGKGGQYDDFVRGYLAGELRRLHRLLGPKYPRIFLIMGNDDPRSEEPAFMERGLWEYMHCRKAVVGEFTVYGYAHVPPTPFLFKDWERYDISRHIDPGCVSPEEGMRSVPVPESEAKYATIKEDLEHLAGAGDLGRAVFLFHTPPYKTGLDRAALDGKMIDHVPLDVHVGSIAVQRFIEVRQPLLTLHGHIHESSTLTGTWREKIGDTWCFSAAYEKPGLALVRFDLEHPGDAERRIL
jgi:Icc-related predicted phosphoesterase